MNPFGAMSVVLSYPDDDVDAMRGAVARELRALDAPAAGRALGEFAAWWAAEPRGALQRRYVATFDMSRRSGLDLTYYTHGDLRQRGLALLDLRRGYAAAGVELEGPELPDHLPVLLEFASIEPAAGTAMLDRLHPVIELLRRSLQRTGSPWAAVLGALGERLTPLDDAGHAEVRRLAREGPPGEAVGLEPFAPPEVMPPGRPPARPCAGASAR